MNSADAAERSWTGNASALSWHYDFTREGAGNREVLRLRLYPDDSTGGNPAVVLEAREELGVVVVGEWEIGEFTAVLLDLVLALTARGMGPREIYPTREARRLIAQRD